MKLTIKNYETLFRKEWDDKNYIEDIDERRNEYMISVWREHRRKLVQLNRTPDDNGYYQIGIFDTRTGVSSVTKPYWIDANNIKNVDVFMNKLKLLTDDWQIKMI